MSQERVPKALVHLQNDVNVITVRSIALSRSVGGLIEFLANSEEPNLLGAYEWGVKFGEFSKSLTQFADALEVFERRAAELGERDDE